MDEDRSPNTSLDESQADRTRVPRPRDEFEGVAIGGRYLLRRRIGEGGFGAVYEAIDERFDSPVAVKLLFGRTSDSEITFRKEAKLIRRFKHPSVVEVYDYGVDDGVAYIVMEFLNGTPLNKYFERQGRRLPTETIRKFVTEIGSALENAHAKHLVHRDLKPQNVMLVDEGQPSERFVLLDLGMATKTDAARDETIGNPMANSGLTPQYAPPEQFRQQPATHLSDIYSFGTILYHLLAGRLPFPHTGSLGQLWHAVEHDVPPPFFEIAADRAIPEPVEAVIRQCLEKQPVKRPQSMRELRERFLKAIDPRSPVPTIEWASGTERTFVGTSAVTDPESHPTRRAAELLSGARASGMATVPLSGSGTLPASGSATLPPSEVRTGRRDTGPASSRRTWLVAGLAGVLLAVVAGALAIAFWDRDGAVPTPVSIELSDEPWVLGTGRQQSFEVPIVRQAGFEGPIGLELRGLPEHVTVTGRVEPASAGDDRFRVTLGSAPQTMPRDAPIVIVATAGEATVERPATLRLVWMPPEEDLFAPGQLEDGTPAGIVSSRETGWNFYERLDRVLPNGSRAPFLLIFDESARDAPPPRPFYMMRNKVWNGLYEAFASTPEAEGIAEEWSEPIDAREPQPGGPAWRRLPVMKVPALDALRFAKWLGGEHGHLPRREQWRTASGFYAYDIEEGGFRDERWRDWAAGPHRGSRVAVGEFASGRRLPLVLDDSPAEGAPVDDIAPMHGVRDMSGNGEEFTSDFVPDGRLSLKNIPDDGSGQVFLVGKSYLATTPLMYGDLVPTEEGTASIESVHVPSSVTGFRVVIEPQ